MPLKQSPHDRLGDRIGVDLVFATTELLLDLIDSHLACLPFPCRWVAGQSDLCVGTLGEALDARIRDWTGVQCRPKSGPTSVYSAVWELVAMPRPDPPLAQSRAPTTEAGATERSRAKTMIRCVAL